MSEPRERTGAAARSRSKRRGLGAAPPWCLAVAACGAPQAGSSQAEPPAVEAAPSPVAVDVPAATSSSTPVAGPANVARSAPPLAALLQDGFESRLARRIKVFVDAAARVRADEAAPGPPETLGDVEKLVVLEQRVEPAPPQVRVVVDTRSVRVALWMDAAQMAMVVTEATRMTSNAQRASSERDPLLRPGLRVKIETSTASKAEVIASYEFSSPDSGLITLRGWLVNTALGYIYEPGLADAGAVSTGVAQFIDTEVDIAARPGGRAIAHAAPGGGGVFFPVQILGRSAGFAEVLLAAPELELKGFVPESALEPLEPEAARGWGRAHFATKLWQRWPKEQVRVPAGTCIYDAPGGMVIGVVKRAHVDNVVVLEGSPDQRAYRLPYAAVGYLFAADLAPARETAGDASAAELGAIDVDTWQCPRR